MKKFRLIIYEGGSEWIQFTEEHSLKPGVTIMKQGDSVHLPCSITIVTNLSEMADIIDRMIMQKEIDSSILPEETI